MGLPLYLACTAEELSDMNPGAGSVAYMACHFSPYGNGLLPLPETLSRCDMLILNDRIPVMQHDPDTVLRQLSDFLEQTGADSLLLDLQRPEVPRTKAMVKAATTLPCAVGVTACYAGCSNGPVLVEMPMHHPLAAAPERWPERVLWLDAACNTQRITVTEAGASHASLPPDRPQGICHRDEKLCCSYHMDVLEDRAEFTLFRTKEDLKALLKQAEQLGFAKAVGLYQELNAL